MFELILWVLFGALAGWVASLLVRTNDRFQILLPIVVGIVGAIGGGALFRIYVHSFEDALVLSLLSASAGAIFVLAIIGFVRQQ